MEPVAEIYATRLPRITSGPVSWSLPLFEPTARALLDALLWDEAERCYQRLLEVVSRDPCVTLWAICTADAAENRVLCTLGDIARWLLAGGIRQHLRWTDEQLSSPSALEPARWNHWNELVRASATAVDPHRELDDTTEDESCLVLLIHNAHQWLEACIDQQPEVGDAEDCRSTCLPRWLINRLNQGGTTLAGRSAARQCSSGPGRASDAENRRRPVSMDVSHPHSATAAFGGA